MKILDLIFGKNKNKEYLEKQEELLPSEQLSIKEGSVICDNCNLEILSYEPRKKIAGKSFHRKCFKKLKSEAKKLAFR